MNGMQPCHVYTVVIHFFSFTDMAETTAYDTKPGKYCFVLTTLVQLWSITEAMILFVQGYRHTNHQFNVRQSLCQATIIIFSVFHSILSAKRNYTLLPIFKTVQYKLLVPKCL